MSPTLSSNAVKVQNALKALGCQNQVVELPQTTRSAAEAACAIGCEVGQIAKSLIFKGTQTHNPILVIASGSNRVDEKKLADIISEPIKKADADFVYETTGFPIGGVPPLGHLKKIETIIDEDLLQYREIWAAAGTPYAVFKLTPAELVEITAGLITDIK